MPSQCRQAGRQAGACRWKPGHRQLDLRGGGRAYRLQPPLLSATLAALGKDIQRTTLQETMVQTSDYHPSGKFSKPALSSAGELPALFLPVVSRTSRFVPIQQLLYKSAPSPFPSDGNLAETYEFILTSKD